MHLNKFTKKERESPSQQTDIQIHRKNKLKHYSYQNDIKRKFESNNIPEV